MCGVWPTTWAARWGRWRIWRSCAGKPPGRFTLADSHPLAAVEAAAEAGRFGELLLPPGAGLDLPRLTVDAETMRRLGFGQRVAHAESPQGRTGR